MKFLFCLLCGLAVIVSPTHFSFSFCLCMMILYLVMWVYNTWHNRKSGIITYPFLFSIAFYFVFYIYPVFLYNSDFRHYILFAYRFNPNYISYCTSLATFAYSLFILGYNSKSNPIQEINTVEVANIKQSLKIVTILSTIIFLYYVISNSGVMFSKQYQGQELDTGDFLAQYTYLILSTLVTVQCILPFYTPKKLNDLISRISLCIGLIIAMYILSTGFRTFTINIGILVLVLYNDKVKRIGFFKGLAIISCGIVLMSLVGLIRGSEVTATNLINASEIYETTGNPFTFANDFIINNRSLYFLVEYVEENGYTYGLSLLGGILGAIPFMSSFFLYITGLPSDFIGSATYNTYLTLGSERHVGLGTNVVADAYIPFGILGMIILFYYFGKAVCFFKRKSLNNLYYGIAYYALISRVIFTPRSGILMNLQICIWCVVIVYIIRRLAR